MEEKEKATSKIRRHEEYTENMENGYKLPNATTMESLQIKVFCRGGCSPEDGR